MLPRTLLLFVLSCYTLLAAAAPQPVIVSAVKQGEFTDRIEALGTLRANESVVLTANLTETVTQVHFGDGERVSRSQVLVEFTNDEEAALLQEAKSVVDEARKQFVRTRNLASKDQVAQSLLDQREREYETAKARLQSVESRLKDHLLRAPFDGVVGFREISVGALVEPGDRITTLDDDSVMKLDFAVPELFLTNLRPGLALEARSRAFVGKTFSGSVQVVGSQIDPVTRSVTVRARIPNPERLLKPGLLMTVELVVNPRTATIIPEESLIPQGRDNYVMVIDPNAEPMMAEKRKVRIGARRPGEVEILDGLSLDEWVVTHGTQRLRGGEEVTIRAVEQNDESLDELLKQQGQAS